MNPTKQISIPQLVEMASLDAFGLLDAEDSLRFEDAFLAAPSRIRDSILDLQAEMVTEDPLLFSETPDDSLREKVLQKVAEAMSERDETLQPLAQIGPADELTQASIENRSFSQSIWTWRAVARSCWVYRSRWPCSRSSPIATQGTDSGDQQSERSFTMNQARSDRQIAWPTDDGSYQVASLVDPVGSSGRIRLFVNQDGSNPRVAYDLHAQTGPLTIYAIDDEGEFGPKGAEYVVAHLNPKDTSAPVVDGFDSSWIGKTRLVARTASGRDVLIQI